MKSKCKKKAIARLFENPERAVMEMQRQMGLRGLYPRQAAEAICAAAAKNLKNAEAFEANWHRILYGDSKGGNQP